MNDTRSAVDFPPRFVARSLWRRVIRNVILRLQLDVRMHLRVDLASCGQRSNSNLKFSQTGRQFQHFGNSVFQCFIIHLFASQRRHGINSSRPPCGNDTGQYSGKRYEHEHSGISHWIERAHSV